MELLQGNGLGEIQEVDFLKLIQDAFVWFIAILFELRRFPDGDGQISKMW